MGTPMRKRSSRIDDISVPFVTPQPHRRLIVQSNPKTQTLNSIGLVVFSSLACHRFSLINNPRTYFLPKEYRKDTFKLLISTMQQQSQQSSYILQEQQRRHLQYSVSAVPGAYSPNPHSIPVHQGSDQPFQGQWTRKRGLYSDSEVPATLKVK